MRTFGRSRKAFSGGLLGEMGAIKPGAIIQST